MLLSSAVLLVSCGEDTEVPADTTSAGDTAAEAVETTVPAETNPLTAWDYLPKKNYDGRTYTIVTPNGGTRYIPGQFLTEQESGDIIMDAAYRRNMTVEEGFSVKIKHVPLASQTQFAAMIRSEIASMSDAYDLASAFQEQTTPLATEGLFLANTSLPYQEDLSDKPWYSPKLNGALNFNGKQVLFYSDMTCITLSCTYGLFWNKSLGEKNGIKGLEQLALDGKWTYDEFYKNTANFSKDLDGNGTWDDKDQYAFSCFTSMASGSPSAVAFQYGMGQFTTVMDEQGNPKLALNTTKMADIVQKLNDLCWTDNRTGMYSGTKVSAESFAAGNILFWSAIIMHAANYMRDMKDTFVVLPQPKYDLEQEEYYTNTSNYSSMVFMVPQCVKDAEYSSMIFDALSYEGYKEVTPAFFEYSMKLKFSYDSVASQLFDIVRESTVLDFGMVYSGTTGINTLIQTLVKNQSVDFASAFASKKDAAESYYKEVIKNLNSIK